MITPTIDNGAFACELFLKALLKNPPTKGKEANSLISLINVYDREQPGKKDFIQQVCIGVMHNIQGNESYSEYYILQLNYENHTLRRFYFKPSESEYANMMYDRLEAEKEINHWIQF